MDVLEAVRLKQDHSSKVRRLRWLPKVARPVTEKAPEQSGRRLTLSGDIGVIQSRCGSYGDPVLEWWRPGGSVLAIRGQGSQADLSLPPMCDGVSQ